MKQKFYRCEICGNIIAIVEESGIPIVCCGQDMTEIDPNIVEASAEHHIPVCKVEGNIVTVSVGETPHPMTASHHISWISIETKQGNQRKCLRYDDEPKACFALCDDDELLCAYAYCNLHGFWKSAK